jgi:O-antigen/teichoic acid export membrane protein
LSVIKKLAGDTAIYGIPSIVGRFIGFILVFFFAEYFNPDLMAPHVEFYAYAAFFFVVLPHGMETAFFNFTRKKERSKTVFTTGFLSVIAVAVLFFAITALNSNSIADFVGYPNNVRYVYWFAILMAIDVCISIPFALLRFLNKAKKFAFIKSVGIIINVGLNIFFVVYYPKWSGKPVNIENVFLTNVISSGAMLLLLLPEIVKNISKFDKTLWKEMFAYSWPLILLGLGGIVNETFDRVSMRHLLPAEDVDYQLGVYGVFYRLSMIMTIFIQAFRYAVEPIFFARAGDGNAKETYAEIMNYFVLVCGAIFLATALFKSEIANLVITNPAYHTHPDGLTIVPILLGANLFLGIFFNLSIWYKLNNKNKIGATISLIGAAITILLLFVYVPKFGFLAAAWTTLIVYFTIAVISYLVGRKYYPVPYDLGKLGLLLVTVIGFYILSENITFSNSANWTIRIALIFGYSIIGYVTVVKTKKTINLPS